MEVTVIKVLVADDTSIGREGLKVLLSTADDIQVVGAAETPAEAVRLTRELEPDIVLMDLKWFGNEAAGQVAIRQIKTAVSKIKIIALTAFDDLLRDAQQAGADMAISKTSVGSDNLSEMIREIFSQKIEDNLVASPALMTLSNLSDREFEVLDLIKKGYRNKEIQESLNIELSTVKNHVRSILQKLDAKNRTEAAKIARDLGY
jgi:DNA-binding NarL/FixJ family response regulator